MSWAQRKSRARPLCMPPAEKKVHKPSAAQQWQQYQQQQDDLDLENWKEANNVLSG